MIAITMLLSLTVGHAKIKNPKTEYVTVYGNCGMCQETIEKAGSLKNVAKVNWNMGTKVATIIYDATKTNLDEILKRIALSGYDSDTFLAPDEVYNNLHGCCQYDRVAKIPVRNDAISGANTSEHSEMDRTTTATTTENQLKAIFDNYFAIKDALVKTDGNTASAKAKELLLAINAVKMETLKMEEHMVWMKVVANLKEDAKHISDTKDVKKQRGYFDTLSKNAYDLIKASKQDTPTYFQHCPMANDGKGADWLSKENTIKNPYFGAMMLSCGKTVETIK